MTQGMYPYSESLRGRKQRLGPWPVPEYHLTDSHASSGIVLAFPVSRTDGYVACVHLVVWIFGTHALKPQSIPLSRHEMFFWLGEDRQRY